MKLTFKYIIVKTGAILFNESTPHILVGQGFKELKWTIFSAGFCSVDIEGGKTTGKLKCYGESDSLKIASKPEIDEIVVGDLFNPVSQIKYFNMNVTEMYNGTNG